MQRFARRPLWSLRPPLIGDKLISEPEARFESSLLANPSYWEWDFWQSTYEFAEGDVKVVERIDEWTAGEFLRSPDPKDGYSLRDLKDPDAWIVVGFLNPIFHPEKPKRIVHKWARVFLGVMQGKCTVE